MFSTCSLCGHRLSSHSIVAEPHAFCCHGCKAVYNILETRNQLEDFKEHPIFLRAIQAGLISNPDLLEQVRKEKSSLEQVERERLFLEIQEMWCPSCAEVIKLMLLREKGVYSCAVDYTTDLASIEYIPRYISKEEIIRIISGLGYSPVTLENNPNRNSGGLYLRSIVASFFALNVMMFAYPLYATYFDYDDQGMGQLFAWLSFFGALPVLCYGAWPILRRFYYSFRTGLFGMEALVVLGAGSAFVLSTYELFHGGVKVYFDTMAVIIAFVLLGKVIEAKAKLTAKDAIFRLNRSLPRRGRKRFPDGIEKFVPIKEISKGDFLIVLTGEKIILDGVIEEGEGACDESLINGESIPVYKKAGSLVLGGSILTQGQIAYRVISSENESSLHKIISMVEDDIGHKTQYVRAVDLVIRWFVPMVVLIASLATAWAWWTTGDGMLTGMSVLLISCPCAIGIAVPLVESYLLNSLACLGVIVRNRGCLAHLGKETAFVFDKTGTVTEGKFKVLSCLDKFSSSDLCILKALSKSSIHPIAAAICRSIDALPVTLEQVQEIPGRGMKGYLNGKIYLLGSKEFFEEEGIRVGCVESCATTVFFNGIPIHLGDQIRDHVKKVIQTLGPAKTILLSGDSKEAVEAVATACCFTEFYSSATPLHKREYIEKLRNKGEIVCMIGDGINDAPALAAAHIGISVLSATDISIQVSDILLTTPRLEVIQEMRRLGIKGRRIIKQNIFWAFFYNLIGIGLAATGYLTPIFSAFAMVASSLMVILNARRLPG